MAPNKDLARLKAMLKKKVPSVAGTSQTFGTSSTDAENIRVIVPLTQIPTPSVIRIDEEQQVPAAEPSSGRDLKRKKSQVESREAGDPRGKRSKSLKSSKHKTHPISVDATFFAKNVEDYKVDPIRAAVELFKHLAEVKNHDMAEFKRRTKEELAEVKDKLAHTTQLLRSKGEQLDEAQRSLARENYARDQLKTEAKESRQIIQDLKNRVEGLETSRGELEKQVVGLEERVKELQKELEKAKSNEESSKTPTEARIAELQKELEECDKERVIAAQLALKMAEDGFQNILDQIELVCPDLHIDPNIIRLDCEVDEGKIIFEDPKTGEKTVVFPEE